MGCGPYYAATIEIAACIDETGTLTVFSRKGGQGSGEAYVQVIEAANWDGSEVSDSYPDDVICSNTLTVPDGCSSIEVNGMVTLTVTKIGEDENGDTIVDVDWSLTGCLGFDTIEGSLMITIESGETCPA